MKPEDTPWQYHGDKNSSPAAPLSTASDPTPSPIASAASGGAVSWEAPEYLAHQRGFGWYVLLAIGGVGVAALIYWITRDIFASVSIVIATGIIGAFALRQPETIAYSLSPAGLTIGSKTHPYNSFKSFSHVSEGAKPNVLLLPAKRFMAPITLHFEPKEEAAVFLIASAKWDTFWRAALFPKSSRPVCSAIRLTSFAHGKPSSVPPLSRGYGGLLGDANRGLYYIKQLMLTLPT